MPAKEVMADYLSEEDVEDDEKAECIDTFILNVKFLGLLRTIAGSERIIPIEQALEEHQSRQRVSQINQQATMRHQHYQDLLRPQASAQSRGEISPRSVSTSPPLEKRILRSVGTRIS